MIDSFSLSSKSELYIWSKYIAKSSESYDNSSSSEYFVSRKTNYDFLKALVLWHIIKFKISLSSGSSDSIKSNDSFETY